MRLVSRLLIATTFAALPRLLFAQSGASAAAPFQIAPVSPVTQPAPAAQPAPASTEAPAATPVGPSMDAATAGIHAHVAADASTRAADHHGGGLGTGGALMIVGGAALIIGLIIGGGAGLVVAIAGAALGLYGLFLFLQ
jgi:hypothetical protein